MKYIIGTGWWCDKDNESDSGRVAFGNDIIRSESFHHVWAHSICKYTSPDRVIVVDSNSPISPPLDQSVLPYEYVNLNENGGHATNIKGRYCGWARSVLLSMEYASLCDCDYYIYVEQDVLLRGKGIIERCINEMGDTEFLFGKDHDSKQPLQQSFFIIKKTAIERFISRYRSINFDDYQISAELKFAMATSPFFFMVPDSLFARVPGRFGNAVRRLQVNIAKFLGRYKYLPIGYGRNRPIVFEDEYFYFQHASLEELEKYNANISSASMMESEGVS